MPLQVLDYVTSVMMGGGKGFLPHLHAGITSACLVKLLGQREALTEFQWTQMQQMAHTLCIRHVNAAKAVGTKLLQGQANPEDSISKLVLALLHLQALRLSCCCRRRRCRCKQAAQAAGCHWAGAA